MGSKKILVTGGAGFIGSHLVDSLLLKNHEIVVYDSLDPQVHGKNATIPQYLSKNITFVKGDIRDRNLLSKTIKDGIEVVYHLAAKIGVAQSMYQIEEFIDTNSSGTANLLDILVNDPNDVTKLIVASSMSLYGEGKAYCNECGHVDPIIRMKAPINQNNWTLKCPICGRNTKSIPTPEDKKPDCTTIYALSKKAQEEMCLLIGKTYGINTTALRFFGTYGSRQALLNPYTGVCAIFSTSLLSGNSPLIYEDGNQTRDLIHVEDICQSLTLSMEKIESKNEVFNVGTGKSVSIKHVAKTLIDNINPKIEPKISYKFRSGDVRHITADITKISSKLGFKPKYNFDNGIIELIHWIKNDYDKGLLVDRSRIAITELRNKNLI